MRKIWLNNILHLSSYIYKRKSEIIGAGFIMSLFLAFYIIFLEILLFIISLPTYFLFTSARLDHVKGHDDAMRKYKLQRKVTLSVIVSIVGIVLFKTILILLISLFFGAPAVS